MNMERFLEKGRLETLRVIYTKVGREPENKEIFEAEKSRLEKLAAEGLIKVKYPHRLEEIAAFNVGVKLSKRK